MEESSQYQTRRLPVMAVTWLMITLMLILCAHTASASTVIFQDDIFASVDSDGLVIDSNNNSAGNITLKFGASLAKTILYSQSNNRFEINAPLDLGNNQLTTARIENVTSLPGGAPGLTAADKGRVVQLTSTDSAAPGCTVSPNCAAGNYSWSGSSWQPLDNSAITGVPSNTLTLDNDNTGGNVSLQFGRVLGETLNWNNAALRFDLSDDLNLTDGLTMGGNTLIMDNDNTGGDIALQFGQTLGKTLSWNAANSRFTFNDELDISGALSTQSGDLALGANPGNLDNVIIPNTTFVRITGPTTSFAIRGISGGYNGRLLFLINTTGVNMTLTNNSSTSTAANRILTNTGANLITAGTGIAIMVYDAISSVWRVISFSG